MFKGIKIECGDTLACITAKISVWNHGALFNLEKSVAHNF